MVLFELKVTPFELLTVRFRILFEKLLDGTFCKLKPLNTIEPELASILPKVLETVPFIVKVVLPILIIPSVKVNTPAIVKLLSTHEL